MQLPINAENVHSFAYTNSRLLQQRPRALVLFFHGLNAVEMIGAHSELSLACAERGILFVQPYDNPWSWMNDVAVRTVDAIVDAMCALHGVSELPVVSSGGSMGGLSALIYARYSRQKIIACAANYPVCDLIYHYSERDDLPRTIVSALAHYDMPLEQAMASISPLHQAASLPDIPYLIQHGDMDLSVNQQMHSERLVAALRAAGRDVRYVPMPGVGHGHQLLPEKYKAIFNQFIFDTCGCE